MMMRKKMVFIFDILPLIGGMICELNDLLFLVWVFVCHVLKPGTPSLSFSKHVMSVD